MVGEGSAQKRDMAAVAAAGNGCASAGRKKIRATPLSPLRSYAAPTDSEYKREGARAHGGDAGAVATTTDEVAEEEIESDCEHMEIDSDAVVSEELVEEEESQSDGEQPESDGEDAAAAAVAAAKEEEEEESQGDGEDHESGGGEEFVDAEGALGGAGVSEEGSSKPLSPAPSSPHVRVGGTVVEDVIVVDADALECGVCCLPLKPPIFQIRHPHCNLHPFLLFS
ncbi:hypothetical protein EJB05_33709, partial [Eragrostis curvula]